MIIQTRKMTAAQKKAQDNFKKAIAYRKKTGCTLKQAFAHVKSGKVSGLDKVVKKGSKTIVLYTKKAKKKAAPKKKASQGVLFGIKKKAAKKPSEKAILKKVHSAKTTSKTLFNKLDKLDEAQHKHMGSMHKSILVEIQDLWRKNIELNKVILDCKKLIASKKYETRDNNFFRKEIKMAQNYIKENNTHLKELKKFL
jgi:hypothetical protein